MENLVKKFDNNDDIKTTNNITYLRKWYYWRNESKRTYVYSFPRFVTRSFFKHLCPLSKRIAVTLPLPPVNCKSRENYFKIHEHLTNTLSMFTNTLQGKTAKRFEKPESFLSPFVLTNSKILDSSLLTSLLPSETRLYEQTFPKIRNHLELSKEYRGVGSEETGMPGSWHLNAT